MAAMPHAMPMARVELTITLRGSKRLISQEAAMNPISLKVV